MATQDPTLVDIDELHCYPRISDLRDPITGLFPPLAGADGEGDGGNAGDGDQGDDGAAGAAAGGDADDGDGDAGDGDQSDKTDWKAESRKHERRAKQEKAEREKLAKALKEREDADKSDQDKAIDKAREEAKREAVAEVTTKTQQRVLKAEIKALAAGKFADPEDAIKLLDLEADDIFDDEGEVQTDSLKKALDDLLERKPHLAANGARPAGDSDAGKGSGGGKSLEDMSVDDHLKRIQAAKKA